jgi:hypothetical protein
MRRGGQTLDLTQREIAAILTAFLNIGLAGVNSHPHLDRYRGPGFVMQ